MAPQSGRIWFSGATIPAGVNAFIPSDPVMTATEQVENILKPLYVAERPKVMPRAVTRLHRAKIGHPPPAYCMTCAFLVNGDVADLLRAWPGIDVGLEPIAAFEQNGRPVAGVMFMLLPAVLGHSVDPELSGYRIRRDTGQRAQLASAYRGLKHDQICLRKSDLPETPLWVEAGLTGTFFVTEALRLALNQIDKAKSQFHWRRAVVEQT